MRRRRSLRYSVAPQSVVPLRGAGEWVMMWKASQRYGECFRKCISAPFMGTYCLSATSTSVMGCASWA